MSDKIIIKIPSANLVADTKKERTKVRKYLFRVIEEGIVEYNKMQGKNYEFKEFKLERMDDDWIHERHSIHVYLKEPELQEV